MGFLGKRCVDRITGFKGVATGYVQYITGCNQVLVVPSVGQDGSLPDSQWFDEQRIQVQDDPPIVLDNSLARGPDRPAPKR